MRTLVHVELKPSVKENDITNWLLRNKFHPKEIRFHEEQIKKIRAVSQELSENATIFSDATEAFYQQSALILTTIPTNEQERDQAINTIKWSIHFMDPINGTTVWGIICIDDQTMTVRWRHRISKSLERVTEEFIKNLFLQFDCGTIFEPFAPEHIVSVREPLNTMDAYIGEVILSGKKLKEKAKKDKSIERRIGLCSFYAAILFFLAGLFLFNQSISDTFLRWLSGACDRLATTAAATAIFSYLNYFFHLYDLQKKPIVEWK